MMYVACRVYQWTQLRVEELPGRKERSPWKNVYVLRAIVACHARYDHINWLAAVSSCLLPMT